MCLTKILSLEKTNYTVEILLADIHDVEKQWKDKFDEWNSQYIVNWKHEYNAYLHDQYGDVDCANRARAKRHSTEL